MNRVLYRIDCILVLVLTLGLWLCTLMQCSTESATHTVKLEDGWLILSAEKTVHDGTKISDPDFSPKGWYEARVPSTVLNVLVENGLYENPYFSDNLDRIPTDQFKNPWWFRKTFKVSKKQSSQFADLKIEGVNYSANIWLNGRLLASSDSITGAFRRFDLKITEYLKSGVNCLAVEVIPPKPGDFTIGFVDWNPRPPDANMGIFRPVSITFTNDLQIKNPYVKSDINFASSITADLSISFQLKNQKPIPVKGKITAQIGQIALEKQVSLKAGETQIIVLTANEFPQLRIQNPRLWWPHNYGEPNLYSIQLECIVDGQLSDRADFKFGIRKTEDYVNDNGYRGFKINGEPILIKGGGWVDDLLLANTAENLENQIKYVKHMNLN
ncbi:MAG: glycoside hydrolase family 2, partial [Candidatus Marinimicrobia bacterium]|nr:glycoside hydrolase family 2 [Candidatus Neomarinimicrobiota bacterium]